MRLQHLHEGDEFAYEEYHTGFSGGMDLRCPCGSVAGAYAKQIEGIGNRTMWQFVREGTDPEADHYACGTCGRVFSDAQSLYRVVGRLDGFDGGNLREAGGDVFRPYAPNCTNCGHTKWHMCHQIEGIGNREIFERCDGVLCNLTHYYACNGCGDIDTKRGIVEEVEYLRYNGIGTFCVCGTRAVPTSKISGIGNREIFDIGTRAKTLEDSYIGCPKCGRVAHVLSGKPDTPGNERIDAPKNYPVIHQEPIGESQEYASSGNGRENPLCPCGREMTQYAVAVDGIGNRQTVEFKFTCTDEDFYSHSVLGYACPKCGRVADWDSLEIVDRKDLTEITESADPAPGDVFEIPHGNGDLRVRAIHDEPIEALLQGQRSPCLLGVFFIYVTNGSIIGGAHYIVGAFKIHEGIGDRMVVDTSSIYVPFVSHPFHKWHTDEASAMREFEILKSRTPDLDFEAKVTLRQPKALGESISPISESQGVKDGWWVLPDGTVRQVAKGSTHAWDAYEAATQMRLIDPSIHRVDDAVKAVFKSGWVRVAIFSRYGLYTWKQGDLTPAQRRKVCALLRGCPDIQYFGPSSIGQGKGFHWRSGLNESAEEYAPPHSIYNDSIYRKCPQCGIMLQGVKEVEGIGNRVSGWAWGETDADRLDFSKALGCDQCGRVVEPQEPYRVIGYIQEDVSADLLRPGNSFKIVDDDFDRQTLKILQVMQPRTVRISFEGRNVDLIPFVAQTEDDDEFEDGGFLALGFPVGEGIGNREVIDTSDLYCFLVAQDARSAELAAKTSTFATPWSEEPYTIEPAQDLHEDIGQQVNFLLEKRGIYRYAHFFCPCGKLASLSVGQTHEGIGNRLIWGPSGGRASLECYVGCANCGTIAKLDRINQKSPTEGRGEIVDQVDPGTLG